MNPADVRIYQGVRIVLNQFGVNGRGIKIFVTQSNIELSGFFAVSNPRLTDKDIAGVLTTMHHQLGRIPAAGKVKLKFMNWVQADDGSWRQKKK